MTKLDSVFDYTITPIAPYDFNLTVRKPAGWSLFTQFEVYDKGTLWTAFDYKNTLIGVRLKSTGTVEKPRINARVFMKKRPTAEQETGIKTALNSALGADQDLKEFYTIAKRDRILKHVVKDLYGMHDTSAFSVFPDAVLAILLQMAPMKRSNEMMSRFITKYGEIADFDGKRIRVWPIPKRIATLKPEELARECKVGYRAKSIVGLAARLGEGFPSIEELGKLKPEEAKRMLMELPGIGDYSSDIINPHGGFPIDVWSAEVFGKLFFGKEPRNNRNAVERVKREGLKRWGKWSWMAFYYTVQDLDSLSKKLGTKLRLT